MTINANMNGTTLEIALEGRLDTMTAPELEAELSRSLSGAEALVLKLLKSDGAWLRMLREGATTTFEAWGKEEKWNTSLCHPWATSPVLILGDPLL